MSDGKTEIAAQIGDVIQLNAEMSYDPDSDDLTFKWEQYKEAGSCENDIEIIGADKSKAFFTISDADRGTMLHIILSVTDNGTPSLTRYKRIVVNIEK